MVHGVVDQLALVKVLVWRADDEATAARVLRLSQEERKHFGCQFALLYHCQQSHSVVASIG
jgi:hypothetical protein